MSLLHQDSQEEIDVAARGEEFTKGSSHVVWASIVAAAVVTIAIAVYVIAGQKPPAATGEIVQVWAHPRHTETSGMDANGDPMPKEVFDQILVFVQIRVHNQSEQPLFMRNILANATLEDGIHSSYAALPVDYEKVFMIYPELASLHAKSLSPEATIPPGQTVEGMVVSAFSMKKQQWDARKDLDFAVTFSYQPKLVLTPHTAVIER